jgi:hypothetical protein
MFYSVYEISIMGKGHSDSIKRDYHFINNANQSKKNNKLKSLLSVSLFVKIQSLFN